MFSVKHRSLEPCFSGRRTLAAERTCWEKGPLEACLFPILMSAEVRMLGQMNLCPDLICCFLEAFTLD